MVKGIGSWISRIGGFDQRGQRVEQQWNYYFGSRQGKLSPKLSRFPYRLDREPQKTAIEKRFESGRAPNNPLIVFVAGTEADLPRVALEALPIHLARAIIPRLQLKQFGAAARPFVRLWPSGARDVEALWREINVHVFQNQPLQDSRAALQAIQNQTSSVAFGFHLDVGDWAGSAPLLRQWVDEARGLALQSGVLVLAVIAFVAADGQEAALGKVWEQLAAQYKEADEIVVLPMLGKVRRKDLWDWRQALFDELPSEIDATPLESLVADLFDERIEEQPMSAVWKAVVKSLEEGQTGT